MARAVIIGGGFFGVVIASHLAQRFPGERVVLLEREPRLMQRASYSNQARIHNGYHYPRSFTTAHRSRVNLPRFVERWPQSAERGFTKVYGIARRNSKVTAGQFVQFCRSIGARLEPAPESVTRLFSPQLIERLFLVCIY